MPNCLNRFEIIALIKQSKKWIYSMANVAKKLIYLKVIQLMIKNNQGEVKNTKSKIESK